MTKRKPGEPLPVHVARKFKEQNEKTQFEARVRSLIDEMNELLERRSELRSYRVDNMTTSITEAIVKKFTSAGWNVQMSYHDKNGTSVSFTITLD